MFSKTQLPNCNAGAPSILKPESNDIIFRFNSTVRNCCLFLALFFSPSKHERNSVAKGLGARAPGRRTGGNETACL